MGWLRLVGSLKLQGSFAEYRLFYRALQQKRPVILRSLLIEATPYHNRYGLWKKNGWPFGRTLSGSFAERDLQGTQSICETILRIWGALHTIHIWIIQLVGSLKTQVSNAKETYKRDNILQKRPIFLRSLLITATPYMHCVPCRSLSAKEPINFLSATEPLIMQLFGGKQSTKNKASCSSLPCVPCRSLSAKEPLIIGLFCGKQQIKIRHSVCLRHPVEHVYLYRSFPAKEPLITWLFCGNDL